MEIESSTLPPNPHYVYMIYSSSHDVYYKGYTKYPLKRLAQHNAGESNYTKNKCPWKLVYLEVFVEKNEALKRERKLKRQNRPFLESLLAHDKNLLKKVPNSFL